MNVYKAEQFKINEKILYYIIYNFIIFIYYKKNLDKCEYNITNIIKQALKNLVLNIESEQQEQQEQEQEQEDLKIILEKNKKYIKPTKSRYIKFFEKK